MWDPRLDTGTGATLTHRADTYSYNGDGVLSTVTPAAQPAWRLDYTTLGKRGGNDVAPYGAADTGKGRLAQVSRDVPTGPDGTNQTAKTTIVYRVPTAGTRATVTYLDGNGREVNTAAYDKWGNEVRTHGLPCRKFIHLGVVP